jgi:peroxiredoxin
VTFPVLFDGNNQVSKLYKVQTMPSTVLIGRDGTMRFIHHGYKPGYENEYQTQVRTLLRE